MIVDPEEFEDSPLVPAGSLSNDDIELIRAFYPPLETELPVLKPFESSTTCSSLASRSTSLCVPARQRSTHFGCLAKPTQCLCCSSKSKETRGSSPATMTVAQAATPASQRSCSRAGVHAADADVLIMGVRRDAVMVT